MRWRPARLAVLVAVAGLYAAIAYGCVPDGVESASQRADTTMDGSGGPPPDAAEGSGADAGGEGGMDAMIGADAGGEGGMDAMIGADAGGEGGMDASGPVDATMDAVPADGPTVDGPLVDAAPIDGVSEGEGDDGVGHAGDYGTTSFYACATTGSSPVSAWPLAAAAVLLAGRRRRRRHPAV